MDAIRLRDYCPRVAVLDIRMDGTDGIRLAEQINDLLPQCAVIFLTAFLEYATDVYETRHVYFILKNELEQRIGSALEKALDRTGMPPRLLLSSGSSVKSVLLRDVLYLERILHKTRVRTRNGAEMVAAPPAELLKDVREGAFIRCHQSYWVNYEHVNAMEKMSSCCPTGRASRSAAPFATAQNLRFSPICAPADKQKTRHTQPLKRNMACFLLTNPV